MSEEPIRGNTVWVKFPSGTWVQRDFIVDVVGPHVLDGRYLCYSDKSHSSISSYSEMTTTDPYAPKVEKRHTANWVYVRSFGSSTWNKRILWNAEPQLSHQYECISPEYEKDYFSGADITKTMLHRWKYMESKNPNAPKERTPHWVHVRGRFRGSNAENWVKRILDNPSGQRCVFGGEENDYIAGLDYGTCVWDEMREIPKCVPWTAQDYAERQIVWLKKKVTGTLWSIADLGDDTEPVMILRTPQFPKTYHAIYKSIAENFTLPDGTPLYKDAE